MKRISKPGRRVYSSADNRPEKEWIRSCYYFYSHGLMTDKEARRPIMAAKCLVQFGNLSIGSLCAPEKPIQIQNVS